MKLDDSLIASEMLMIYSYNIASNNKLSDQYYRIDSNGYIHFSIMTTCAGKTVTSFISNLSLFDECLRPASAFWQMPAVFVVRFSINDTTGKNAKRTEEYIKYQGTGRYHSEPTNGNNT